MSKTATIIIGVVIGAVLLGGVGYLGYYYGSNTNTNTTTTTTSSTTSSSTTSSTTTTTTPVTPTQLMLQTTTSMNDSGLLPLLQTGFEQVHPEYNLTYLCYATGTVLANAGNGLASVVIVHSNSSEWDFLNHTQPTNGYTPSSYHGKGIFRVTFAYNYFVIVGDAASDPANVANCTTGAQAFGSIFSAAQNGTCNFVSRNDTSGTNNAEITLWKAATYPGNITKVCPSGIITNSSWYFGTGQGMMPTLQIANNFEPEGNLSGSAKPTYTIVDMATWFNAINKTFVNYMTNYTNPYNSSTDLKNTYSVEAVDPTQFLPGAINYAGAKAFIYFMAEQAQQIMANYIIYANGVANHVFTDYLVWGNGTAGSKIFNNTEPPNTCYLYDDIMNGAFTARMVSDGVAGASDVSPSTSMPVLAALPAFLGRKEN
jgi:tungstate transport system substrate-binding protein